MVKWILASIERLYQGDSKLLGERMWHDRFREGVIHPLHQWFYSRTSLTWITSNTVFSWSCIFRIWLSILAMVLMPASLVCYDTEALGPWLSSFISLLSSSISGLRCLPSWVSSSPECWCSIRSLSLRPSSRFSCAIYFMLRLRSSNLCSKLAIQATSAFLVISTEDAFRWASILPDRVSTIGPLFYRNLLLSRFL